VKQETRNHELIAQYLLGELSEQEKILLEQQYFGDDDFFEELLVVEGEIIDTYVRDELPGDARERFEAHYLASPRLRQRVEIARSLVDFATDSSASMPLIAEKRRPVISWRSSLGMLGAKNRAIRVALAAAVLMIAVGGSWLIVETVRLRNQVERIQADRAEMLKREQDLQQTLDEQGAQNGQLESELRRERSQRELLEEELTRLQRSTSNIVAFVLTPNLIRGASEPKTLTIPRGARLARINLIFEHGEYPSYRAVLETVDGNRIWSSGSLKTRPGTRGKMVTLGLLPSLFAKGDYILTLSGLNADGSLEGVGEYYFNVVKK
jgi:hypothetical protein